MPSYHPGQVFRSCFTLFCLHYFVLVPIIALAAAEAPFLFTDVTAETGLDAYLHNWQLGHGAAWGDVTGNGRPDLYVGAYADRPVYSEPHAPVPNMLFINKEEGFILSPDEEVRIDTRGRRRWRRARTTMALFADLNNNHRLDLLIGNHQRHRAGTASRIFANRWPQDFLNVTPDTDNCDWPEPFAMRNATVLDLNHNGLLDLILIDGLYDHDLEEGQIRKLTALRNHGDFTFSDISREIGFPQDDTFGLGLAVGDVNNNGRMDLFIAHSNRLLLSRPDGTYREYRPGFFREPEFHRQPKDWPRYGWPCGAAFADLTGNGLLDLVFTVHGTPPQIFLYVNRAVDEDGQPQFENVTEAAGLLLDYPDRGAPLPWLSDSAERILLHGAQVALVDLDNNGRRDILLGMIHLDAEGRVQPVAFRNRGNRNGIPRFTTAPVDSWIGYYAAAPVADFDRDGRIDIFMANWHDTLKSHLFRNVTEAGNFLTVSVVGQADNLNSMGIGAVVRIYAAGHAGDPEKLLGRHDIVIGTGYSSGEEARAHFGLGTDDKCDLMINWQEFQVIKSDVQANQHLEVIVGDED